MNARTAIPRGWEGPTFRDGRDVPCHGCEAMGYDPQGLRVDVDDYIPALCGNCEGTGIEPQRPAGKRDTRAPIFDSLHDNVTLRSARERAARASRDGSDPVFAIHCRRFHREAVRRFIGKAVRA